MVNRFLITTALEETWRDNEPVLFLGEWCRRYSRKKHWSKMDAEVLPYHWDDREKLYANYQYLLKFYERLLGYLSVQLNQIHKVDHSSGYWRILIGPWLGFFVPMLFDRWSSIHFASSQYDLSATVVLTDQEGALIPSDMGDFMCLFVGDEWNHQLYGAILQEFTSVSCINQVWLGRDSKLKTVSAEGWKHKIKRTILKCYSRGASIWVSDRDAFFLNTYLSPLDEIRLCQRLREAPQFWPLVSTVRTAVNKNRRKWVVAGESHSDFEACARTLIPRQIPVAYLEGYKQLIQRAKGMAWPKQPKMIWTSNAHIANDVFKVWAAEKTESGSPLVIGQHGGHYGTGRWSFLEDHELSISACYLSWGWSKSGQPKIKPVGCLKAKGPLGVRHAEQKRALLVTTIVPRYSYTMQSIMFAGQYLDYFNDQCIFVENLPTHIRKKLTVRLSLHDYGWDQVARWLDSFPSMHLDEGRSNINDLISHSRLYISTYNATTFIESITMNVPTVIYWNPCHWELRDSAIPFFEDLQRVGIFHDTPESAARHVNNIWDDVEAWWTSPEVREVLESFKQSYCRMDKNMLSRLEVTLRSVIAGSKIMSPTIVEVGETPTDML
jgi:putative transferase (TIGR04331 family)